MYRDFLRNNPGWDIVYDVPRQAFVVTGRAQPGVDLVSTRSLVRDLSLPAGSLRESVLEPPGQLVFPIARRFADAGGRPVAALASAIASSQVPARRPLEGEGRLIVRIHPETLEYIRALPGASTRPAPDNPDIRIPIPSEIQLAAGTQVQVRVDARARQPNSYFMNIMEPSPMSGDSRMALLAMGIGVGQGAAGSTHGRSMRIADSRRLAERMELPPRSRSHLSHAQARSGFRRAGLWARRWSYSRPAVQVGGAVIGGIVNTALPNTFGSESSERRSYRMGSQIFHVLYTLVR